MTTRVIHGFNIRDGGAATVARLVPYLSGPVVMVTYGPGKLPFITPRLIVLRRTNREAAEAIMTQVKEGDFLIAHSNGALIAWEIAQRMDMANTPLGGVVVINPALRRDTIWPVTLPVLCMANSTDWIVQLGRVWSRLVSLGGLNFHGWGAAGRYGFSRGQKLVTTIFTDYTAWDYPVKGHSGVFGAEVVKFWSMVIEYWIAVQKEAGAGTAITRFPGKGTG